MILTKSKQVILFFCVKVLPGNSWSVGGLLTELFSPMREVTENSRALNMFFVTAQLHITLCCAIVQRISMWPIKQQSYNLNLDRMPNEEITKELLLRISTYPWTDA